MSFSDDDNYYYDIKGTIQLPHKNPCNIISQVIPVAITFIVIVFLVVLVLALHYCARRIPRRRRATFPGLGLTGNRVHEPPKGLDPTVIASLPLVIVKRTDGEDTTTTAIECAVCLGELEAQEMARLLPNCKHTFHAECIDKWLASHSTCPICRTEIVPRCCNRSLGRVQQPSRRLQEDHSVDLERR